MRAITAMIDFNTAGGASGVSLSAISASTMSCQMLGNPCAFTLPSRANTARLFSKTLSTANRLASSHQEVRVTPVWQAQGGIQRACLSVVQTMQNAASNDPRTVPLTLDCPACRVR